MPDWVQDAIWWQLHPLGAAGAPAVRDLDDPTVTHALDRYHGWLDYAIRLGVNGLALQPVFASQSHGYDTTDYYTIDPRLGDEADLVQLIEQAHQRGIAVLLDGVFNHVGTAHPAFRAVLEHGPDAATSDWFRLTFPDGWRPGDAFEYANFEGHTQLVALDHDRQAVVDLVVDVMCYWLERGADGWRLDAAYAVPPQFWARVLPRVRERFPQCYVVGEVIHGDFAAMVAESGMDAVTQYPLWHAIWNSLNDGNLYYLDHALDLHNRMLGTFVPWTFVGNHDVTRIASALNDPGLLPHALAVLMTVGGTPAIYYGDEQGFRGVKEERLGGDDEIRPPLPTDPTGLSLLGAQTLELHQQLIGLRRRHRWLHTARTTVEHLANLQLVYRSVPNQPDGVRSPSGDGLPGDGSPGDGSPGDGAPAAGLLVALNLADQAVTVPADGAGPVLAGDAEVGDGSVALAARGWAICSAGPVPGTAQS